MSGKAFRSRKAVELLDADVHSVATHNGPGIDRLGFDALDVIALIGTPGASATVDIKLQHSDDNSTFADVDASVTGDNAAAFAQQNTAAGALHMVVNLQPCKRYIRAVAVVGTQVYDLGIAGVLYAAQVEPAGSPDVLAGVL